MILDKYTLFYLGNILNSFTCLLVFLHCSIVAFSSSTGYYCVFFSDEYWKIQKKYKTLDAKHMMKS